MEKHDKMKILVGIILFGSVWGMLECILGSVRFTGIMAEFPMGALLGGLFGLGIMAFTRRLYGFLGMQLGIAIVAGLLRFWAPVGSCVICSALAIMAEGFIFELIFNRPVFDIARTGSAGLRNFRSLAMLGVIAGFVIYVTGYMFTQIFTPLITTGIFNMSNFTAVLPLIIGRGFFAAVFGGIALPVAVLAPYININLETINVKRYYTGSLAVSALCWVLVLAYFYV